jgi:hypothetical protein
MKKRPEFHTNKFYRKMTAKDFGVLNYPALFL